MRQPAKQKQPVIVNMPAPENTTKILTPNLIATVVFGIFAFAIVFITNHFYEPLKQFLHLGDAKVKKFQDQVKLLSEIAFIISIFLLVLSLIIFIITHFFNRTNTSPLVLTLRRVISNSLEQFIIFLGLYAYVVTQKGLGFSKKQIVLIGNWFIIARYFYLGGSILEQLTGINFKQTGVVLTTLTILILISQIIGFEILQYI